MIIDPKLWDGVPDHINYLTSDDFKWAFHRGKPTFDPFTEEWSKGDDLQGYSLHTAADICSQLNKVSKAELSIAQRPSSYNGCLQLNQVVSFSAAPGYLFKVIGVDVENKKISYFDPIGQPQSAAWSDINSVNGVAYQQQPKVTSQLPPEAHNTDEIDGQKAMDILKGMLA